MDVSQLEAGKIVVQVLKGRNLNQALNDAWKKARRLTPEQKGAIQDLSYGTLRYYGQLKNVLEQLLHKPAQDEIRCLLLVALYQLNYSKAAPYAVVDHAVKAARSRFPAASGLVNAILRNFMRSREALLEAAAQTEAGRYAYPQWWIDKIKAQYGERTHALLFAGNEHPPMTLRVNRRRTTATEYLALLAQHDISARIIEPAALLLDRPLPVTKLPGFNEGLVSVQDAGAQYAAHFLDVRDGMRVLDACSAPGGKSAHLLELADIDLISMDKDATRLERVRENFARLQLSARIVCGDAAAPKSWWDRQTFDRILADVPCSASGVVRRHPDIKWLRRPEDIEGFATRQLQIVNALWRLLARDGKLLYATCSIFARENRQVIDAFLKEHDDAALLPLSAPNLNEGAFLPDDQHDGFFYALLHRAA
jgi:16S rRNA (cytosine967-C5)-methyltransferase